MVVSRWNLTLRRSHRKRRATRGGDARGKRLEDNLEEVKAPRDAAALSASTAQGEDTRLRGLREHQLPASMVGYPPSLQQWYLSNKKSESSDSLGGEGKGPILESRPWGNYSSTARSDIEQATPAAALSQTPTPAIPPLPPANIVSPAAGTEEGGRVGGREGGFVGGRAAGCAKNPPATTTATLPVLSGKSLSLLQKSTKSQLYQAGSE